MTCICGSHTWFIVWKIFVTLRNTIFSYHGLMVPKYSYIRVTMLCNVWSRSALKHTQINPRRHTAWLTPKSIYRDTLTHRTFAALLCSHKLENGNNLNVYLYFFFCSCEKYSDQIIYGVNSLVWLIFQGCCPS